MGYFISVGALLLLALAGCALALLGVFDRIAGASDRLRGQPEEVVRERRALPGVVATLAIFAAIGVVITLLSAYEQVEAGHVGVVRTFGSITGQIGEGANWIAPWQQVQHEDVRTRKAEFRNAEQGESEEVRRTLLGRIDAGSQETQNVFMDVAVNYNLDPARVQDLFRSVGPQWFTVLVPERVRDITKAVVVDYAAIEVTQKREQIRQQVIDALRAEFDPYGIRISSVQLANIRYDDRFENEIEQKQVATQSALRAEEQVRVKEAEARQNEAQARGEALREIAVAEGNARSTLLRANAQAEANRAVAASLTPALVQYTALDKLKGVSIALVPADGTTIIDPTGILRGIVTP